MKVTNAQVLAAQKAIVEFIQARTKAPMDVLVEMRYLGKELDAHAKIITETHGELLRTYGEEKDDGSVAVDPLGQNFRPFVADYEELMQRECEITHLLKRSWFTCTGPDGKRVPMDVDASIVFGLGDLLVDDSQPTKPELSAA